MKATKANVTKVLKAARLSQHRNDSYNAYSRVGFTSQDFGSDIVLEYWNKPEFHGKSNLNGHTERTLQDLEIAMARMLNALQAAGMDAVRNPERNDQIIISKAAA